MTDAGCPKKVYVEKVHVPFLSPIVEGACLHKQLEDSVRVRPSCGSQRAHTSGSLTSIIRCATQWRVLARTRCLTARLESRMPWARTVCNRAGPIWLTPRSGQQLVYLTGFLGAFCRIFLGKNCKPQSSLNFIQSGPQKFTKSDFRDWPGLASSEPFPEWETGQQYKNQGECCTEVEG